MQRLAAKIHELYSELQNTETSWSSYRIALSEYLADLRQYGKQIKSSDIMRAADFLNQILEKSHNITPELMKAINQGIQLVDYFMTHPTEEEKKEAVLRAGVIPEQQSLEASIQAGNARIESMVQRQQFLPKVITGERVLRTRLTYDNIYPMLTRQERKNNHMFMNQFSWVQDGVGGVGHQQPLPFQFGLPSDNKLDYRNKHSQALRFSGKLFDSGAYVRKKVFPTQALLDVYHASTIRETPIYQKRMSQYVTATGPGQAYLMKSTNDLAPPAVLRRALYNRLYFQTLVDGKWT